MGLAISGTPATVAANSRRKKTAKTVASAKKLAMTIHFQWIRRMALTLYRGGPVS